MNISSKGFGVFSLGLWDLRNVPSPTAHLCIIVLCEGLEECINMVLEVEIGEINILLLNMQTLQSYIPQCSSLLFN